MQKFYEVVTQLQHFSSYLRVVHSDVVVFILFIWWPLRYSNFHSVNKVITQMQHFSFYLQSSHSDVTIFVLFVSIYSDNLKVYSQILCKSQNLQVTIATCTILESCAIGKLLNDFYYKTVFFRMFGLKNWDQFSTAYDAKQREVETFIKKLMKKACNIGSLKLDYRKNLELL